MLYPLDHHAIYIHIYIYIYIYYGTVVLITPKIPKIRYLIHCQQEIIYFNVSLEIILTVHFFFVCQSTAVGTTIFSAIKAKDADTGTNGQVRYSVVPGDGEPTDGFGFFTIPLAHKGQISVAKPLDFERTNVMVVRIQASVSSEIILNLSVLTNFIYFSCLFTRTCYCSASFHWTSLLSSTSYSTHFHWTIFLFLKILRIMAQSIDFFIFLSKYYFVPYQFAGRLSHRPPNHHHFSHRCPRGQR